jgi:hypothetical protein
MRHGPRRATVRERVYMTRVSEVLFSFFFCLASCLLWKSSLICVFVVFERDRHTDRERERERRDGPRANSSRASLR